MHICYARAKCVRKELIMAISQERLGIQDFYVETVLPALATHLDSAFPEFGWQRDARGWVATNQEMTHRVLGVRADRVVAHGDAPAGFLIHGGEPTLWTAYLNGGQVPRASDFVDIVIELARRAGVDSALPDRAPHLDRRADLLDTFAAACQAELVSDRGDRAREYLIGRGLPPDAVATTGLGMVPDRRVALGALRDAGFADDEIARAGVLDDRRWQGRVLGVWRTDRGRIGTLWTRSIDPFADEASKYLYLKGASRTDLAPYGFADLRGEGIEARREVILVEGLLDVHQLRARGMRSVVAVGGTSAPPAMFERLARAGVESVILAFDNDDPGRRGAAKAVEAACRAKTAPAIRVVEPTGLGDAKDPDAFVRDHGITGFEAIVAEAGCGVAWRANELVVANDHQPITRRVALGRAGRWLGTLPPRLSLEQEDAIHAVAERCGYSPEATARTFRARFWTDREINEPGLDLSMGGR